MTLLTEPLFEVIRQDLHANRNDPRSQIVVVWFRFAQFGLDHWPIIVARFVELTYRIASEWVFGIELRPKTRVGPGVSIFHGVGLVVNDHAILGRDVILRNGVTIGHQFPGGRSPVIGDGVEFGANSIAIGNIRIGDGARIGAGAVVAKDVPPNGTAVGNPCVIRG